MTNLNLADINKSARLLGYRASMQIDALGPLYKVWVERTFVGAFYYDDFSKDWVIHTPSNRLHCDSASSAMLHIMMLHKNFIPHRTYVGIEIGGLSIDSLNKFRESVVNEHNSWQNFEQWNDDLTDAENYSARQRALQDHRQRVEHCDNTYDKLINQQASRQKVASIFTQNDLSA